MCQYRYQYFPSCRHSETRLFEFCEHATPVARAGAEVAPALEPEIGRDLAFSPASSLGYQRSASLPELPSDTATHDTVSIQQQDMAGLPAFSGSMFSQFITGKSGAQKQHAEQKASKVRDSSPTPSPHAPRQRQPGIREHTDESCDLPSSNDILEHMTESYHGIDAPHPGIGTYDDFDNLEAEIEQLNNDVSRLRESVDHDRNTSPSEWPSLPQQGSTTPQHSKLPIPTEQKEMSAAARLQKIHEDEERAKLEAKTHPSPQPSQQTPMSPMDFPSLGSSPSVPSQPHTPTDARRSSYADALQSGLSKKSAKTATAPRSSLASQESTEDDGSVIVGHAGDKQAVMEQDKGSKQAPHFAQPTQSYARRAGETLRKEGGLSSPQTNTESRTIKSKEPDFATEKRVTQRQQKRKSLPGDWMDEAGAQGASSLNRDSSQSIAAAPATKQSAAQHAPPTKLPVSVAGLGIKVEASPTKASSKISQAQQSPRLQKKTSTYMSPTNATTQRTAATLGKERQKHDSQSPKKRVPRLDTSPTKQQTVAPSLEAATAGSDTPSVHFILEPTNRPAALVASPISRSGSPVAQYFDEQRSGRAIPAFGFPHGSPSRAVRKSRMQEHFVSAAGSVHQYNPQPVPPADYGTLYSMPTVANTNVVRRTSNQQILRPVLRKLSAVGLARPPPKDTPINPLRDVPSNAQENAATSPLRDTPFSPESPAAQPMSFSSALRAARSTSPREAKEAEDRPAALTQARGRGPLQHHRRTGQGGSDVTAQDSTLQIDTAAALLTSAETVEPPRFSPYSSLRATADEFTPMQQPIMSALLASASFFSYQPQQPAPPHAYQELLAFRSPEEWLSLPIETKMLITRLRGLYLPQRSRYGSHPAMPQYNTVSNTRGSSFTFGMVDENGSPQIIQAGATLKSNFSPGKKSVHWSMDDSNGTETPVKFGRAPAPPALSPDNSSHASISPTSDDTSPLKTPRSIPARPWSIGSSGGSHTRLPYGWTGGDGKEIRFVGYGPHAERYPNDGVDFDFQGRKRSTSNVGYPPETGSEDKENISPPTFGAVAPRSQKQWAQKLGLDRVPCGTMKFTHATEMMPFADHIGGYCFDCAGR